MHNARESQRNSTRDATRPSKAAAYSSKFRFFDEGVSLVSYVPKRSKAVSYVLSTQHQEAKAVSDKKAKPEIIRYYNVTKSGIDVLDKLIHTYSCKRPSKRWTMCFFCNLLDIQNMLNSQGRPASLTFWNRLFVEFYTVFDYMLLHWILMANRFSHPQNKSVSGQMLNPTILYIILEQGTIDGGYWHLLFSFVCSVSDLPAVASFLQQTLPSTDTSTTSQQSVTSPVLRPTISQQSVRPQGPPTAAATEADEQSTSACVSAVHVWLFTITFSGVNQL